jgi:hypothetical protein
MRIYDEGQLSTTAQLPAQGQVIGDAFQIDNHYWLWLTPAGANFPSWVDP